MQVIGFRDGFRGLMENRTVWLDDRTLSGILTHGGTILGTSRDKPYAMNVAGKVLDMTDLIVENYRKHHLDVLVCLGGGGTQKNAFHLARRGLNVITLPKTIDNDVAVTDVTFGFDTALGIATEAIDRLHSHRPQPPPDHRGGGDGPQGGVARARRWRGGRSRRDPDPRDPVRHRARSRKRSCGGCGARSASASWPSPREPSPRAGEVGAGRGARREGAEGAGEDPKHGRSERKQKGKGKAKGKDEEKESEKAARKATGTSAGATSAAATSPGRRSSWPASSRR